MMGSGDWYHARGGQQVGPVSREELTRRLMAGDVGPDDLVWREGLADWQPARAVAELAAAQPAYPAPGPQPAACDPGAIDASAQQQQHGAAGTPMLGYGGYRPPKPGAGGLATTAFVISLVALVVMTPMAVVSLVLGIVALVNARRTGRPKGLAVAAVVISGLEVLLVGGLFAYLILHR